MGGQLNSILFMQKSKNNNSMRIFTSLILLFLILGCSNKKEEKAKQDDTNLVEKAYNSYEFDELIKMKPNERNFLKNNFESENDQGYLSNEEVFELIKANHDLPSRSKITLLDYTFEDEQQKWIYRINITKRLLIKQVEVFEAVQLQNKELNTKRFIFKQTKVF